MKTYYEIDGKFIYITSPYCEHLNTQWRKWGGKFETATKRWKIADVDGSRQERIHYNMPLRGEATIQVEIPLAWMTQPDNYLMLDWIVIGSRPGRDRQVQIYEGDVGAGSLPSSGGSRKNPSVDAAKDLVIIANIPERIARKHGWEPQEQAAPSVPLTLLNINVPTLFIETLALISPDTTPEEWIHNVLQNGMIQYMDQIPPIQLEGLAKDLKEILDNKE